MPEISSFCGIKIEMYYDDHNPPHFHAKYGEAKALVDIQKATVIKGALPNRQLRLVLAWCLLRQEELMHDWELAKNSGKPEKIQPIQ